MYYGHCLRTHLYQDAHQIVGPESGYVSNLEAVLAIPRHSHNNAVQKQANKTPKVLHLKTLIDSNSGDNWRHLSSVAYELNHMTNCRGLGLWISQSAMGTCPSPRSSGEAGFAAISKCSNQPAVMRWFDATLEVINSVEMGLSIRTSEAEDYGNLWERRSLWECRGFIYDPPPFLIQKSTGSLHGLRKDFKCTVLHGLFIWLRSCEDLRSSLQLMIWTHLVLVWKYLYCMYFFIWPFAVYPSWLINTVNLMLIIMLSLGEMHSTRVLRMRKCRKKFIIHSTCVAIRENIFSLKRHCVFPAWCLFVPSIDFQKC